MKIATWNINSVRLRIDLVMKFLNAQTKSVGYVNLSGLFTNPKGKDPSECSQMVQRQKHLTKKNSVAKGLLSIVELHQFDALKITAE